MFTRKAFPNRFLNQKKKNPIYSFFLKFSNKKTKYIFFFLKLVKNLIAFLIRLFLINRYYWVFLIIYSDSSFTSRAKPKPLGSQGKDHLCSNIIPPCSRLRLLLLLYLLTLAPVGAVHYIPLVYNKVNKITGFQSIFDLKSNNHFLKKLQNIRRFCRYLIMFIK